MVTFFLVVLLLGSIALNVALACLLGFRLGGDSWAEELLRVRQRGAVASRQIHDLYGALDAAMAEHVERRRRLGR